MGEEWLESCPAGRDLEVPADSRLNVTHQHALEAKKANHILGSIIHRIIRWSKEMIILLYSMLVWPHLEYCVRM